MTPRPRRLRRCSCNDAAARIPGIRFRTVMVMNLRHNEVRESRVERESSEEMRRMSKETPFEKRNSDSDGFKGS